MVYKEVVVDHTHELAIGVTKPLVHGFCEPALVVPPDIFVLPEIRCWRRAPIVNDDKLELGPGALLDKPDRSIRHPR